MQHCVNHFSTTCDNFGFTISTKKTEVMQQPAPRKMYHEPHIFENDEPLKATNYFTYPGSKSFFLTMLRQHSQYDSRLGFSFRVLVRVRLGLGLGLEIVLVLGLWLGFWVRVRVRVDFRVRVRIRVNLTLTLTKTIKLNPNLLSYWECCRNMVRKTKFAPEKQPLQRSQH